MATLSSINPLDGGVMGEVPVTPVVEIDGAPELIDTAHVRSEIHRDPLGVCAAITPWNFPFRTPHWMVLPALLAGNTVVFKPSEETPLVGQACADLLGADRPDDALHGADAQGAALGAHPGVDAIAFTGSRAVGKRILREASAGLARVNRGPGGARGTPWVGARESGFGDHRSPDGHRPLTQTRVLSGPR